jgi:hypothetical protein
MRTGLRSTYGSRSKALCKRLLRERRLISRISTCFVSKFQTTNAQKCFGFQPFLPLMSASSPRHNHRLSVTTAAINTFGV